MNGKSAQTGVPGRPGYVIVMDLSIIIISFNTKQLLSDCIASIYDTVDGLSFEIWVVDNGSSDGSPEAVKKAYPEIRLIQNNRNKGFAAANNQALRRIKGKYGLLLNSDTVLTGQAVRHLYDFMENHPKAAMSCGQLLNADGSLQNSTANFPTIPALACNESLLRRLFPKTYLKKVKYRQPVQVESCIGACLMVRRKAMEQVGLLDERYFFFFEETDYALRMQQAGWESYLVPAAEIYHLQGSSVGHGHQSRLYYYQSRYLYFKKWRSGSVPFIYTVVFFRLLVNTVLNGLGLVCTFGLNRKIRNKLSVYIKLVVWHIQQCPQVK